MSEIDWNVELRKIEREYDGLPPEPSPAALRAQRAAEARARDEAEQRLAVVAAVGRLVLVGLLVGGLSWWPYATSCGAGLAALLAAQTMIVVGGLWTAIFTFRYHLPTSHTIALAFVLTGLVLLAAQVLPRLGYVTIPTVDATHWRCVATVARDMARFVPA